MKSADLMIAAGVALLAYFAVSAWAKPKPAATAAASAPSLLSTGTGGQAPGQYYYVGTDATPSPWTTSSNPADGTGVWV